MSRIPKGCFTFCYRKTYLRMNLFVIRMHYLSVFESIRRRKKAAAYIDSLAFTFSDEWINNRIWSLTIPFFPLLILSILFFFFFSFHVQCALLRYKFCILSPICLRSTVMGVIRHIKWWYRDAGNCTNFDLFIFSHGFFLCGFRIFVGDKEIQ